MANSMEPKEKAKQLVNKFLSYQIGDDVYVIPNIFEAKGLALICVDELLERDKKWFEKLSKEYPEQFSMGDYQKSVKMFDEVKTEIQNL